MNYECLICQINALQRRLDQYGIEEGKRNTLVGKLIKKVSEIDLNNSYSPEVTRNLLRILEDESQINDPYKKEKQESNAYLLSRYDEFKKQVQESDDSFDTALRFSIAGNIIDFGPTNDFDVDGTIEKVLNSPFSIDDSKALKAEIEKAESILYLADNCGEIVMDKLFLETIAHKNVTFAVREKPVLNDATKKEAIEVGIPEVAKLISNGDDCPSTILHRTSSDFMDIYRSADVIVAKGMGNFEGLMNEKDPRLFFLLMVKCPVIGRMVGAEKGEFVVKNAVNVCN
jgi:uncharacterized protein with ATP-grasp and redox domains